MVTGDGAGERFGNSRLCDGELTFVATKTPLLFPKNAEQIATRRGA